ncbi:hypothetical protein SLEP1_g46129 [Rubroshorea leprosula]|uniref:Uncharacterized protein n=1 Tax=Rubroshorea leprosula TaxID=152421 RepID=A0AAV5LLC5_9ROSI|nr:hypothetical protein SLEP1_g46129 [Rubroshorea leprosula]
MVKKTPAYKNRLQALELERSGGTTNKKSTRQMDKKIKEDLSKELELDTKGVEKPCIWKLIGVRFGLLPYTLGKVRDARLTPAALFAWPLVSEI